MTLNTAMSWHQFIFLFLFQLSQFCQDYLKAPNRLLFFFGKSPQGHVLATNHLLSTCFSTFVSLVRDISRHQIIFFLLDSLLLRISSGPTLDTKLLSFYSILYLCESRQGHLYTPNNFLSTRFSSFTNLVRAILRHQIIFFLLVFLLLCVSSGPFQGSKPSSFYLLVYFCESLQVHLKAPNHLTFSLLLCFRESSTAQAFLYY